MIYFDFAATTPLDKEAAEVYVKVATEYFGNSNSLHDIGSQASSLLENCREELANRLGIDKRGLYFTSGGSEGNFLAIEALLSNCKKEKNHIITGIAEHSSVHGALKRLEKSGYSISFLPFDPSGLIDEKVLLKSIQPETALIALQHVNSEIGTIQPIKKIAEICREKDIYFHSDFVQSFGKMELHNITPLVSSCSFSGHKIYGPKGTGGVYIDPNICWNPFFPGSTHERGFRPGTVNVPAIAAMTVAAQKIYEQLSDDEKKSRLLRQVFLEQLNPINEWVKVHQANERSQLPSIMGLSISGVEGQWIMLECNRSGFSISTGSACQAGMQTPSKTMQALGLSNSEAKEFVRISFGKTTTIKDVEMLGKKITDIVQTYKNTSFIHSP